MKTTIKNHKHTWIVSSVAIILAITSLIILPHNKSFSLVFAGVAGSHLLLALIAVFTGWMLAPEKLLAKMWRRKPVDGYDFGWSSKWLYGFLFASILVFLIAVHVYFTFEGSEVIRLIIYSILLLLSVNMFIANIIIRNSDRTAHITLPSIPLLPEGKGTILDAGCGAGRTTVALGLSFPEARITSFDRFDADYIDDGGINLLKQNINMAKIQDRVTIEKGDITQTPFNNNQFDAVVSSFMFDHLGNKKLEAIEESYRILKPDGKLLLIIVVRSYTTFGIANVLSFLFPTRATWKKWMKQNGFVLLNEGNVNEGAYFYFEKPKNN